MKKIFVFIGFICIFSLCGCIKETQETIRPVEYTIVTCANDITKKTFFGYLKSASLTDLSFQIEGKLKKIFPYEGQKVKAGQLIAQLDAPLYKIQVQEAKYNLSNAVIQYENAKNYFERIQKLHAAGGISDNDMDSAKTKMESANYQIQAARERYNYISYQSGYEKIFAPANGIIVTKLANEQQYLRAGDPVVKFQSNNDIEAFISVPQDYINYLKRGQGAKIKIDAIKDKIFSATIKEISETSLEGLSYRVRLKLDAQNQDLKDGMSASAVFVFEKTPQKKLFVPINSILEENNQKVVYTIENRQENIGTVKKNIVQTGEIEGNNIEITCGIKSGDYLITKGTQEVQEGQRVKFQ